MHARVFVCVCSSTNSKHFLFRADYGRLLLIGLVDSLCVFFVVIYFISSLIFHILSSLFLCGKNFLSAFLANESRKIKTQFMYISICFYTLVHFFSLAIVCLFVFNTRIVASSRAIFIYSNEMSCVGIKIVHVKLCWHSFDVVLTLCLVFYFFFLLFFGFSFVSFLFRVIFFYSFVCLFACCCFTFHIFTWNSLSFPFLFFCSFHFFSVHFLCVSVFFLLKFAIRSSYSSKRKFNHVFFSLTTAKLDVWKCRCNIWSSVTLFYCCCRWSHLMREHRVCAVKRSVQWNQ